MLLGKKSGLEVCLPETILEEGEKQRDFFRRSILLYTYL